MKTRNWYLISFLVITVILAIAVYSDSSADPIPVAAPVKSSAPVIVPVTTKGMLASEIVITDTTPGVTSVTKGFIGNDYVKTKSVTDKNGTVTTKGYVGGKYVKVKTKKD